MIQKQQLIQIYASIESGSPISYDTYNSSSSGEQSDDLGSDLKQKQKI